MSSSSPSESGGSAEVVQAPRVGAVFPVELSEISWSSLVPDTSSPQRGGMGTVFRALWMRRGARVNVAVKVLRASVLAAGSYDDAVTRFRKEVDALRLACERGGNRWVVPLFGVARGATTPEWIERLGREIALFESRAGGGGGGGGPAPELFGLVMAWQDGGTLAEHIHGAGRVASLARRTAERLLLLEHVADGVVLLHSADPMVVHGDLKPENVLLTPEREPRLSDFGMAQVRAAISIGGSVSSPEVPGVQAAGGSWPYMAPEMSAQLNHGVLTAAKAADRRTDVFALATLCWEVLAVQRPWADFDSSSRLAALRAGESLDWARLPEDVPEALRALLKAGVALDSKLRPSAPVLRDGLRDARERLESSRFDVFLSHAWDGNRHAPATAVVHRSLREAGRRLWIDMTEMGGHTEESMRAGVAASTVVVALISRKYASRPPCMLELGCARELHKPVVFCVVEPDDPARGADPKWFPSAASAEPGEAELAALVAHRRPLLVLLGAATAVAAEEWGPGGGAGGVPLPPQQRARLDAPEALPRLLRLVSEALGIDEAPPEPPLPPLVQEAGTLKQCVVCVGGVKTPAANGVFCKAPSPTARHFVCDSDLDGHLRASIEPRALAANMGMIRCPAGCAAESWKLGELKGHLPHETELDHGEAIRRLLFEAPRWRRESKAAFAQRKEAANDASLPLDERVRLHRGVIVDRDLTLLCPKCAAAFVDFVGSTALVCATCGCGFCGLCLLDCGNDASEHHFEAHGGENTNTALFNRTHRERRAHAVAAAVRALAGQGAALQRALVAELAKADLPGLGIGAEDVLREAGVE